MEKYNITNINELKRDILEQIIKELSPQEKQELKEYLNAHPGLNAAGIFTTVRGYIFNKYFRTTPIRDRKRETFASTLNELLDLNSEEEENE